MSVYDDMAELIRLGAYRRGTDPTVDRAIELRPALEKFLAQRKIERSDLETGYNELAAIVGMPYDGAAGATPTEDKTSEAKPAGAKPAGARPTGARPTEAKP
jgi:flagellum-specific ATP synthase